MVSCAFSGLCVYSKFGHHPHPLCYLCAKFCFFRSLRCSASPWRTIAYSINHSISHSPSLFDALSHCYANYSLAQQALWYRSCCRHIDICRSVRSFLGAIASSDAEGGTDAGREALQLRMCCKYNAKPKSHKLVILKHYHAIKIHIQADVWGREDSAVPSLTCTFHISQHHNLPDVLC